MQPMPEMIWVRGAPSASRALALAISFLGTACGMPYAPELWL